MFAVSFLDESSGRAGVAPGVVSHSRIDTTEVYGRSQLSWQERLNVERSYVDCPSLSYDLRILMLTFPRVCHRDAAF